MIWFSVFKAVLTRLLFAGHAALVIHLVASLKSDSSYYLLALTTLAQVAECIFTMVVNKGGEWKWFCPGVVVFLLASVPAIWILELQLFELRMASKHTVNGEIVDDVEERYSETMEWILITEQMLPLLLIVGRWLLPKGATSRDQLSQLLLVYFATASDIIEFFDGFKEDTIKYNRSLVITLLTLWSWSLLQFSLVMTATRSTTSSTPNQSGETPATDTKKDQLQRALFKRFPRIAASRVVAPVRSTSKPRDSLIIPIKPEHEVLEDPTPTFTCLDSEVWSVVASILLQDAPFLVFRLTLILHYKVYSHTNVFFTCKNIIVVVLQVYRIVVLHVERRERLRKEKKAKEKLERRLAALKKQGFSFPPEENSLFETDASDVDPYLAAASAMT